MTQKDNKGFLLLHLSVFIAGFTGVLGRLIELDSAVLVWHRMAWAAVLMALFLLFRKELQRYSLKDIAQMGGVGVLLCLHWIFFYASIKASNVSIGVVCFSLVGFFTALFEPIINKHRFSITEFLFSIHEGSGLASCVSDVKKAFPKQRSRVSFPSMAMKCKVEEPRWRNG